MWVRWNWFYACRTLVPFVAAVPAVHAQDIDTVLFSGAHHTTTTTEDPIECRDFSAMYQSKGAAQRHVLAMRFVDAHPQSWLLAQTYDIAAKASIDLGNYRNAIDEAKFSLRLLPENPILLVPIANLEAKSGSYEAAERDGRYAAELLDEFMNPSAVSESKWHEWKPQLAASAWFAVARSLAARGRTVDALTYVDKSISLNPADKEALYLRALIEKAARKPDAPEAHNIAHTPIEHEYAGSESCRECHSREYDSWTKTGMARMFRNYRRENIMGDFSEGTEFRDDSGQVRMGFDSRPYFEVRDSLGAFERFHVDATIGSKWQQGYITRLPDGRLQVLPVQYSGILHRWMNYWKIIDPPGSERANLTMFAAMSAATNYQQNCAICHTSQLRASTVKQNGTEYAQFRQGGVNCEMCHGPAAAHIRAMRGHDRQPHAAADPPVDFLRVDNRAGVRVCAQCHQQSAVRQFGTDHEMNYVPDGPTFVPAIWSRPYTDFDRKAFYKDGRFRETTFLVEALRRSACYRRGTAQCAACHDPHPVDAGSYPVPLKYRNNPDELCLQCHGALRTKLVAHTHHAETSEGSRCVSCHMPRIVNALMFKARSHQIDDIPRADLTERFGQDDSPNACLLCHNEKNAAWVQAKLRLW